MVLKSIKETPETWVARKMKSVKEGQESPSGPDDATLVQRCNDGDVRAFQTLVQRYQKKLFATAYGMVHHPDDALDIVQEAFLKVYRHLPKFQGNSSFYTWTYRIVVNLCIDFLRKEGRHQTQDYDETIQQLREPTPGEPSILSCQKGYDPAHALKNKELGQQIANAIDTLSLPHRSVIILRELEGMSYEEIAQTLECSKGTVMSRLHHARARMREALNSYLQRDEKVQDAPMKQKGDSSKERKQKGSYSS